MQKNKIIAIGRIGSYECYLNMTFRHSIRKYCEKYNYTISQIFEYLRNQEIETKTLFFDNEFWVYDLSEC